MIQLALRPQNECYLSTVFRWNAQLCLAYIKQLYHISLSPFTVFVSTKLMRWRVSTLHRDLPLTLPSQPSYLIHQWSPQHVWFASFIFIYTIDQHASHKQLTNYHWSNWATLIGFECLTLNSIKRRAQKGTNKSDTQQPIWCCLSGMNIIIFSPFSTVNDKLFHFSNHLFANTQLTSSLFFAFLLCTQSIYCTWIETNFFSTCFYFFS